MPSMLDMPLLDDESAEELATDVLLWLAANPGLMRRFLDLTGIEAGEIRAMLGERRFYAGLFGFLLNHEPTMVEFCQSSGHAPEWVQACHRQFSGPEDPNWT